MNFPGSHGYSIIKNLLALPMMQNLAQLRIESILD